MSVLPLRGSTSTTTTVLRPKALERIRKKKENSKRACRERAIRASKEEEGLVNSRGRDSVDPFLPVLEHTHPLAWSSC